MFLLPLRNFKAGRFCFEQKKICVIVIMEINIIVAADEQNAIGKDNGLLCRLQKDLKNFKELTTGHPVVMGRKTFESLPKGALPNRTNIVMSKSETRFPGCYTCTSAQEVLELTQKHEKIFVIGGRAIYEEFFPIAHKIYLTRIRHTFEDADVFFPEIDVDKWRILSVSDEYQADEKNEYPFFFSVYERI